MATSGVEEDAGRLLGAFYDLSGHNPMVEVSLGLPESPEPESAAKVAGLEAGSTRTDVALRYLLNQRHVVEGEGPNLYRITVMGIGRVREIRGLD